MAQEALRLHVLIAESKAKSSSNADVKAAAVEARRILDGFAALADQAARDLAEKQIRELTGLIRELSTPDTRWGPRVGIAAVVLVAVLLVVMLWWYLEKTGMANLAKVEYTRPLLVITAIIATVVFGGALLFAALYTSDDSESFSRRFRPAREIFLVFSGIFGTIIGFYFGAGVDSAAPLDVTVKREKAVLIAKVTGGSSPYQVIFEPKEGESKSSRAESGLATFDVDAASKVEGEMLVTDGRGGQVRKKVEEGVESEGESKKAGDADKDADAETPKQP